MDNLSGSPTEQNAGKNVDNKYCTQISDGKQDPVMNQDHLNYRVARRHLGFRHFRNAEYVKIQELLAMNSMHFAL